LADSRRIPFSKEELVTRTALTPITAVVPGK